MMNKKVILAVTGVLVLMLVVSGVAFAAGTAYGKTQAENTRAEFLQNRGFQGQAGQPGQAQGQPGQNDQNAQGGRGGQFGRVAAVGTVKSVDGNKITVTIQNGSTVTVTVDNQTQIIKTVSGAISDIQTGSRVMVMSDQTGNNITARAISIQPQQPSQ